MTQHPEQPDTGHQPVRQTGRPGRYHTLAAGIGIAAAMICAAQDPSSSPPEPSARSPDSSQIPSCYSRPPRCSWPGSSPSPGSENAAGPTTAALPHPPSTTAPTTAPPESPSPFLEGTTRHHDIPEIPPFSVRSPAQAPRLRPVSGSGHGTDNRLRQLTERPVDRARRFVARRGRCRCCYGLRH